MLTINVPSREMWDEKTNTFLSLPEKKLTLEHSLASISKWESRWHIPFLNSGRTKEPMTNEQMLDYICCMSIGEDLDIEFVETLPADVMNTICQYIENPMTATTINDNRQMNGRSEVITSEVLYYRMITCGIPFECQYWHINRLLTLIRVCDIKNSPDNKMKPKDVLAKQAQMNAERMARMKKSKH